MKSIYTAGYIEELLKRRGFKVAEDEKEVGVKVNSLNDFIFCYINGSPYVDESIPTQEAVLEYLKEAGVKIYAETTSVIYIKKANEKVVPKVFRGFSHFLKQWVYWDLFGRLCSEKGEVPEGRTYLITDEDESHFCIYGKEDASTICELVAIDVLGNTYYERDIIRDVETRDVYVIEGKCGSLYPQMRLTESDDENKWAGKLYPFVGVSNFEVIGNLLEGVKK